jgi:hypothetical protein
MMTDYVNKALEGLSFPSILSGLWYLSDNISTKYDTHAFMKKGSVGALVSERRTYAVKNT